jgi:hypothetical protein
MQGCQSVFVESRSLKIILRPSSSAAGTSVRFACYQALFAIFGQHGRNYFKSFVVLIQHKRHQSSRHAPHAVAACLRDLGLWAGCQVEHQFAKAPLVPPYKPELFRSLNGSSCANLRAFGSWTRKLFKNRHLGLASFTGLADAKLLCIGSVVLWCWLRT